jgi:hypothetical protein
MNKLVAILIINVKDLVVGVFLSEEYIDFFLNKIVGR